jgi:hypothetical protein
MFDANFRTRSRAARRRALCAIIVVMTALVPALAPGQESFQLRYNVDRTSPGQVRVNGTVVNDARVDVIDVYVTAEALDAGGKVLGRGIAFVSSSIPQHGTAPFTISIPAAQAATSFRVRVSSFRFGMGLQTS